MKTLAFLGRLGAPEVLLILVVILLLFGAKRLPDLARSLGKSLSEFKKGKDEAMKEITGDKPEDRKPEEHENT